jgi:lipid-binding SYLF domain-containing protein
MCRLLSSSFTPLLVLFAAVGCSTVPKSAEGKPQVEARAATAVSQAKATHPSMARVIGRSMAYAVFPRVGKGGLIVGGAWGRGVLYEGDRIVGYCDLTQGSFGLQAGGQAYAEIIAFSTGQALDQFKNGSFAFDAQATAVAPEVL